jgi:hypothetical protein
MESRGHWQELTKQRVQKPSVPDDLDHPMHVPLQDLIHVAGVVLLGYDWSRVTCVALSETTVKLMQPTPSMNTRYHDQPDSRIITIR